VREVKFRAFHPVSKKWFYDVAPQVAISLHGKTPCMAFGYDRGGNRINLELVQYTGKKDANFNEVYEGHIFRLDSCQYEVVEYSEDQAAFVFSNGDMLSDYYINEMEIVGNIYENPELLEVRGE